MRWRTQQLQRFYFLVFGRCCSLEKMGTRSRSTRHFCTSVSSTFIFVTLNKPKNILMIRTQNQYVTVIPSFILSIISFCKWNIINRHKSSAQGMEIWLFIWWKFNYHLSITKIKYQIIGNIRELICRRYMQCMCCDRAYVANNIIIVHAIVILARWLKMSAIVTSLEGEYL